MRKLVIAAAVLIVLAALVLWLGRGDRAVAPVVPTRTTVPDATAKSALAGDALTTTDADGTPAREQASVLDTSAPLAPDTRADCHVFGRVVDERNAPLADVHVRMWPTDGSWLAPMQNGPKVVRDTHPAELKTTTDSAGRFRFDMVLPTTTRIVLSFEPSIYYACVDQQFGSNVTEDRPKFIAGDNDIGDVPVPDCGAVAGRVLGPDGAAIEGALVRCPSRMSRARQATATSDATGRFVLAHVLLGKESLTIEKKGLLTADRADVELRRNTTTELGDIVLARAPTISGTVVETSGAPVEGVTVEAWPRMNGMSTRVLTEKDGTFTLQLPRNESYRLQITRAPDFEPWGDEFGDTTTFDANRTDVRIVLTRAIKTTFRVVDAKTRAPIESFGIGIYPKRVPGMFVGGGARPSVAAHPGGELSLAAKLGASRVDVIAPGYVPMETDVMHDSGSDSVQTLALDRASSIDGRLVLSGSPLASASIRIARDSLDERGEPTPEPVMYGPGITNDVNALVGAERTVQTASDGTFVIGELSAGTYLMKFDGQSAARTVRRGVRVPALDTLHLGDVELLLGATVRGRVVTAAGDSPVGFVLRLDRSFETTQEIARVDGAFEFTGLAPGAHSITWDRKHRTSWSEDDLPVQRFDLAAGETRDIVIEAIAPAEVSVVTHVMRNGHPLANARIEARVIDDARQRRLELGTTNAEGTAKGEIQVGTTFELCVMSDDWHAIGDGGQITAEANVPIERTITIALGTLVIELPATIVAPEVGCLQVALARAGHDVVDVYAWTPKSTMANGGAPVWEGRVIAMGEVPAGEFQATIGFERLEPLDTQLKTVRPVPIRADYVSKVTIEDGREARIVVP